MMMDTAHNEDKIGNWPYNVWDSIALMYSQILGENEETSTLESKAKNLNKLLDHLPTSNKCLIPVGNIHSYECQTILKDSKCFNVWLFGQLVGVQLRDNYKHLHDKCFQAQLILLNYLRDHDLVLYQNAFGCYISSLREICAALECRSNKSEGQLYLFKWFKFDGSNQLSLPKIEYRLHGYSQLAECLQFLISMFVSLNHELSVDFCIAVLVSLWKCAMSLLSIRRHNAHFGKVRVYKFVTYLLRDINFSYCSPSNFNGTLSNLLEHVMNDVSILCQTGKLGDEEDFCVMLNTLIEKLNYDIYFDYTYPQIMYLLVLQQTVQLTELVEDTLLKFLMKLVQLSDYTSVGNTVLENSVSSKPVNVSVMVAVMEGLIKDSVQYHCKYRKNLMLNLSNKDVMYLYQVNEHWKRLLNLVIEQTTTTSKQRNLNVFKTAISVSQLAVNVTTEVKLNNTVVFFESVVVSSIVDSLVKLFYADASKKTLSMLLKFAQNILSLEEARIYEEKTRNRLLTLLTLSWLPTSVGLSESIRKKYLSYADREIQEFCLVALMNCVHRFDFTSWRDMFFDKILINKTDKIMESLPVLLHSLSDYELEQFLKVVYAHKNDVLNGLSLHLRALICGADYEHSSVIRPKPPSTRMTPYIRCSKCDDFCSSLPNEHLPNITNSLRRSLLNELIIRTFGCSEEAEYNVLCAAVDLFRHIPKTIELLNLLQKCFFSSNLNVRKKVIEITPYLIFRHPGVVESVQKSELLAVPSFEFCSKTFKNFMECLQAITLEALTSEDVDVQYVCLNAVVRIGSGKLPLEVTLLPCVGVLLNFMLNASSAFGSLAKSSLQQIAINHDFQVEEHIYLKYREYVFPLVAQILVVNFNTYGVTLKNLLCQYTSVFNELTVNHVLQYLLPHIARDSRLVVLMDELASLCDLSVPQLLRNAFRYILPHVMLFESSETAQSVMEMLYKETNNSICELLSCCVTRVLAELFVHYEEMEDKVRWVLREIRFLAPSERSSVKRTIPDSSIEWFLQSRFFGVLMKLENQLSSDMICDATRRRVLSSFKSLIRFVSSSYITSVRFKVLLTLRTITDMERENSPTYCIDIWDMFVRKLDPNVLGPILSTIFVSLLPFIDTHKERVNQIFGYLIIDNGSVFSAEHMLQLYFLPKENCAADIYKTIEKSRKSLVTKRLEERLEWLLSATKHEVIEIKLYALRHLKKELAANRAEISRLILASDSVNRLVFHVLDVLVDGFRNADTNIQRASGECLGEFGAIDPSYIPNMVIKENDSKKYNCYHISDVEFVVQAFTLLCRGFQMAKTSSDTDAFALAIQSLLNSYKVTRSEECKYWRQIPEQLREIIQPFYSTTYTLLTYSHEMNVEIPHMVYGSAKCSTVQKWAFSWSTFLISLLPAESKAREIFTFCKGPLSCEIKCMLLFLPQILLNAVLAADDENLVKIYEEMVSIIKHDSTLAGSSGGYLAALPADHRRDNSERTSTQMIISEELSVISNSDQEMGVICTKTIFNLLDVLNKKFRDVRAVNGGLTSGDAIKLNKFLSKFSKWQLAQKAFDRKEYMRGLLYLEEYLYDTNDGNGGIQMDERHLSFLAKIYFHLNDVDNVKGLFATHNLKLHQLQNVIMLHEITDQFQDAAICYQQLLKTTASVDEERALFYEKRAIQSYLAINQPELALRFVNSLSSAKTKPSFYDVECEALWNLSQFDKLEKLITDRSSIKDENWGVRIGQSLIYLLKGERKCLEEELNRIRTTSTKSLQMSTAALGGYRECYEHTVKLHILNEFEKVADLVFGISETENIDSEQWRARFNSVIQFEFDERLHKLQPTSRVLQPVLNMRQALFAVASRRLKQCDKLDFVALFNDEIRRCWLKIIEMANRTRNFELAYSNIIAIDSYQVKGFFIEKAKYYWEKREQQEALRTLQHGLQFHYPDCRSTQNKTTYAIEDSKICAEALMLLGSYNDAVANSDSRVNLNNFVAASKVYSKSEQTLLKLAQYYEKVILASGDLFANPDACAEIVRSYGKSLIYGCEFIYQSLSKMLNIWLDLAERWHSEQKQQVNESLQMKRKKCFQVMTERIKQSLSRLPTYYFLTAFSLIMSRLMHPVHECFSLLESIIVHCICAYPNQALWQFTSMYRPRAPSSGAGKMLSERVNKIFNNLSLSNLSAVIAKFKEIFGEFSQLCLASKRKNISAGKTSITSLTSTGSKLLKESYYEAILVPAQKFITIVLPRSASNGNSTVRAATVNANDRDHNPFPEKMVNIVKVRTEAFVYSSLQKPVRITLVGTDGYSYPMIFKAMDDLRIDSRAMEFNAVVNMYLKRDAEARNRALVVRTYTVLPLYETNGIIEFIPNLDSMRNICVRMRRCLGLVDAKPSIRCDIKDPIEKKREVFRQLRRYYKPVLHEWYKMEFPNPSSWYTARTSYVRTLAVMSVVGYILGLGDRHNDNILLDQTNGDIVHVDFNALFNKGETLPWPERVPFRLTHSMVMTMGPLGYEGCFRYTCEIVNRIIRAHKDQLISVLDIFLYDPSDFLTEVSKSRKATLVFEVAAEKLRDVEARMNGVVRALGKNPSMPLSVEGQIDRLIEEATDEDNLCQMFHGWGAYM